MEFHVLLVDDDRVTLKTIEQLLRKCNYEVTCAANGREAMKVLTSCRQSGKKVDLVLTDILMPEVTGIELIHEMVHGDTFCDAPVVVMSSQDSQESVLQAFQAGAADYLIKPIRKNELATLWQHVWRATKAKKAGSGTSCPATIAAGDPLTGREESEVAAAIIGGGVKAVATAHGPVNDRSGASSGATTSVIQSTGGSMLPAHAATVRQLMVTAATPLPPGTSEQSGNMNITEAKNSWSKLFHHASSFDGGASSAAHGSSAMRPFLGDGGGSSNTPHTPAARRSTGPFCTSVSVNFDLNPSAAEELRLEHLGAAHGAGAVCWPASTYATAAAATPQCAARTSATVIRCLQANPEEAEPKDNRDADADIIATAAAPVLDGAAAADGDYGDIHGDSRGDGENPLRKRKRLATGPVYDFQRRQVRHPDVDPYTNADDRYAVARPAMTTARECTSMKALITVASDARATGRGSGRGEGFAAATAAAVGRLAVAEGSQGSRAASACAEGEGCGAAALRQSTTTPSSDTFAESPSPYSATVTTTATITVTTSSGSEADEQQSQQPQQHQQQRRNRELPGGTSAGCLLQHGGTTARTDMNGLRGAAVGRVVDRTMAEAAANGTDANTHCTATSAGPEPAPALAAPVAAAPTAQHSLPHPSAAAPPRTASSGGVVALPPGLRELARLGSARHRELWAQRAMLHDQQQQQQLKEVAMAHVGIGASSACGHPHQSLKLGRGGGAGVGHSGVPSSAVEATEPEAPARGPCDAAQGATAAELHPQRRRDVALENDNERGSSRAGAGGGGDFGTAASSRTESTAADGAGAAVRSQSSHSLALLRHSDRSAFAAFSVFLPGRLAAPPALPQQQPQLLHSTPSSGQPPAPLLSQQVAAAAATAASGGNGSGNCTTSMLYSYHPAFLPALPPQQHDLRYPGPLLQPGVVHLMPSIVPLHIGVPATAVTSPAVHGAAAPKHADPAAGGAVGLGSAAGGAVGLGSAAAAAAVASVHAPYAAMQQGHGVFCPPGPGLQVSVPHPPVRIEAAVLHLIAQLSGRGPAQIPLQETITPAPFVGQKAQSAARLAAVAKYLEKRKRRNFQKKVRYESRKRLAEARPRVRGQFVRSTVPVTAPGPSTLSPWQPQDPAATSPTAAVTAPLHAWGPASAAAVLQLLKMLPVPLPSVG